MITTNPKRGRPLTPWQIFHSLEGVLGISVYSNDTAGLIVAISAAAVVLRVLEPLKLPGTERLPVYLAGCIVNKLVTTAIANAV